jgi:aromatic ring-opening dioxygenase catalytic subunit (LigB family)
MERGGSTPFNLIKFGNVVSNGKFSAGKCGLGAAGESKASFFTEEIVFGSISMRSVLFEE